MNDVMKTQITQMRTNGMSFGMMSLSLGLPASTIKSFCRRNGIEAQEPADKEGKTLCECCGKLIEQNPKRKLKRFCSDRCRNRWWSNNMDKVNRKESLIVVCCLAVGYVFITAIIMFNVEPDTFPVFFDAIYWATVSLTTVGYGDLYAVSTVGRIITMISSVFGVGIIALPAGIITAGYMEELKNASE